MSDQIPVALQNLITGTASEEEISFLKQELAMGRISIGGNVNQSIVILGNGNKVEITSEALDRLNVGSLLSDVEILNYKTKLVLAGIYSKLANDIEINRQKINEDFEQKFPKNKLLIFKGEAGAGKSAYAKMLLSQLQNYAVFAFKSDSFAKRSLKESFPDIRHSFNELLQHVSQQQSVVILIDSLEKLLEIENYDAFRELLRICQELSNIKIFITCRSFAWQQIIFDLHGDFPQYDFIEIPVLNDVELTEAKEHFPTLNGLFENSNIKQLLRKPFYLNILILHSEITNNNDAISEKTFRKVIWEKVVSKRDPKRASAFENIAIQRARSMSLYAKISNPDLNTIKGLLDDGIILSEEYLGEAYCPSHDIYEDLALIRYIERIFQEKEDVSNFFRKLGGKEPAIRRAFRLWLNDQLWDAPLELTIFVTEILDNVEIEQYWKDEIIIAILQSKYCKNFFDSNLEILQKGDWTLLLKFIHLLRTACQVPDEQLVQTLKKSIHSAYNQWLYLKPNGSGWEVVINFIYEHFDELNSYRTLIFRLIVKDWSKLLKTDQKLPLEAESAGKILLSTLEETKEHYGSRDTELYSKKDIDEGIITLFKLCSIFHDEVGSLITEANSYNRSASKNYKIGHFYDSVIGHVLSGLYSREICKELPDMICEVAKNNWLQKSPDTHDRYRGSLDIGEDFGLSSMSQMRDFPSGIYKTPIRFLLYFHPSKALGLIVSIINLTTESYANSKRGKGNGVLNIEIQLENGLKIIQTGDAIIWGMYRGFVQTTPYLLQSILMSLENWLLELCQINHDWSDKLIQFAYTYLLNNSNSVATTAVLASVGIAYPEKAGKFCFPILRIKEFYRWDINRLVGDQVPLAPLDRDMPFAQEERHNSNQLPHRKHHLEYLMTKQQVGGYWEEANAILDEFQNNVEKNDTSWKLAISRMDIRKYEVDETIETPEKNQVALIPKLDEDLVEIVEKNNANLEITNKAASIGNWARRVFKKDKDAEGSYEQWLEEYTNYQSLKGIDNEKIDIYASPIYLAAIGIRDFRTQLTEEERNWCVTSVLNAVQSRIVNSIKRDMFGSVIFLEPAIATISHILSMDVSEEVKKDTKTTIFLAMLHLTDEHENPYESVRTFLWDIDKDFANACFAGLLEYAKIHRKRKFFYTDDLGDEGRRYREEFIKKGFDLAEKVSKEKIYSG